MNAPSQSLPRGARMLRAVLSTLWFALVLLCAGALFAQEFFAAAAAGTSIMQ